MKIEDLKAYEVLEKREIKDISSTAIRLRHIKTGAKIALLSNDDDNKVFYIGFRTPPADSTGVAHITEHSVLCGSKAFPLKDPFVELAKGSLNTFLNAMTYPDKTVYPVASCNDKDFQNLMHVYLDAVFYPNTYSNEAIFRQEGWHYEFDEEDKIFINGVVYNEMKGAFSSPEDVLSREVLNSLYPDTSYGVESGGDPDFIPDLTYEQFLDFHKAYYHPTNSYIYLYGNMDMAEKLDFIDKEYLSSFERRDVDSVIKEQPAFSEVRRFVKDSPLAEGESEKENTYMSVNYTMGKSTDRRLYLAMQILDHVLVSVPGAPIKKALVEKGIASDIFSVCENGIYQPYFSIVAKDTELSKEKEFLDTVNEVLEDIVKNGFDKKALLGGINHFEFQFREADFGRYPKGLMYGLQAFDSWLYDDDAPFSHIEAIETIEFLKANVDTGYFEDFVKKYMLDNTHKTVVLLKPTMGLQEKKDEELKEKLAAFQATLSDEDIKALKDKFAVLNEFQEREDTPENLAKLPLLERKDLKREALEFRTEEIDANGTKLLLHDYNTNGIGYLRLVFSLKDLPGELYPYVSILKSVLGKIDTDNYSYIDLNTEMFLAAGGMTVKGASYMNSKNPDDFVYTLEFNTKYLHNRVNDVAELLKEVMFRSHLNDTGRIFEILAESRSQLQATMTSSGHAVAISRAMAGIKSFNRIAEILSGVDYYRFLSDIVDNYDAKKDELVNKLKETLKSILRPENLLVDFISNKGTEKDILSLIPGFTQNLYTDSVKKERFIPSPLKENEALITAGQVLYVCRAGDFCSKGIEYTGALNVLKTIMGYQYLWVNVRVKGGAYGCFSGFNKSGNSFFVSYRDPNLSKTIEVYEKAAAEIENIELDERSMTQFIIGTISEADIPLSPVGKGSRSFEAYMTGYSYEEAQKTRNEVLDATPADIRALSKHIKAFMSDNRLVVVGNATKIKEEKELFDKIENLF